MKRGVLLINLGTPDEPTPEAVGRYLKIFLMDPYVIDIPKPFRAALVHGLIVPRRKYTSAAAYKTVWTERGSPLAFHHADLVDGVAKQMSNGENPTVVVGAMRYGRPSIETAVDQLIAAGVQELTILPLYPQYAESSSKSSMEETLRIMSLKKWRPSMRISMSFWNQQPHIDAWVDAIVSSGKLSRDREDEFLLLSFHGLPERHLKKCDPTGNVCLDGGRAVNAESEKRAYTCCDRILETKQETLSHCYRAQSVGTSQLIIAELSKRGYKIEGRWAYSFQSRLGRTPWIKPYTDKMIENFAKAGVGRLVVATPSFVADCLETIEEIGDRARHDFLSHGGAEFDRIECLNSRPSWINGLSRIIETFQAESAG